MRITLAIASIALVTASAGAQLTIRVDSVPAYTPVSATMYLAGSFNNWNPADSAYRLVRGPSGKYRITLPESVRGDIEYKFTLGSWNVVEVSSTGGDVENRRFTIPATGAASVVAQVRGWKDPRTATKKRTARATVAVLSDSFAMPELGRTRRVWIYTPPDYATSNRRYPVLYLQDGQNLFDESTAFATEWGIDETLDSLAALGDPGAIVVGVDNGGSQRLSEYNPWPAPAGKFQGGAGDAYATFLARTLKPYVDARYRTRPERASTSVGGSSAGALVALYAALKYGDVFGSAILFSPAIWLSGDHLYQYAHAATHQRPRLYFMSGAMETPEGQPANDQRRMVDSLTALGIVDGRSVRSVLPADGKHSEWFWRREFPAAYRWVFGRP